MIVALHGFTETDLTWLDLFEPSGLDVSCPLLPGHGWLPCSTGTDIPSTAAALADKYAGQQIDLLGYSMGGRIALRWAIDHPESVRRLILVSTRAGIEDSDLRQARQKRDEGLAEILEEDGISTFVAWWENQNVLKPFRPLDKKIKDIVLSRRLNQDPLGLAASLRALGQGVMEPIWDRLSLIKAKTLLVCGEADDDFLPGMQRMQESIPNATLCCVPECGHAIHRERPKELLKAVAGFLAE